MKTTTAEQLYSRFFSFQNLLIYVVKLDVMIESIEEIKVFGIKLINSGDFLELLLRLLLNTFVVYWISNRVYVKNNQNYQFYFGYNTISIVTFLMCFLLSSVKLELGFALGLFALFTIIRFRSGTIPIKEMTYLFVVIGVAVINALANKKVSYIELLLSLILALTKWPTNLIFCATSVLWLLCAALIINIVMGHLFPGHGAAVVRKEAV